MIRHIYLDIETIPCQKPGYFEALVAEASEQAEREVAALKPPASLKKQETIDAWIQNDMPVKAQAIREQALADAEDKYRATSFDGAAGQIAVIGAAVDDRVPLVFYQNDYMDPGSEKQILWNFKKWIGDVFDEGRGVPLCFIGHNITGFDLRFIFQRSVVLGMQPHPAIPFTAKPWEDKVFDTMTRWACDIRGKASMNKVCEALGLDGKGDLDGSKVWDYVRSGKIKEVAEYCAQDVERTRAMHKRLTFAQMPYPVPEESFNLEAA